MLPSHAPSRIFLFFQLVCLTVGIAHAEAYTPPPLPGHVAHVIENSTDVLWMVYDSPHQEFNPFLRWNPATGQQREYVVPRTAEQESRGRPWLPRADTVANTGDGLMFNSFGDSKHISEPALITLITDDGKMLTTHLSVPRAYPHVLVLADRSVLYIGGGLEWDNQGHVVKRSSAVERVIYRNGKLETERLPDLPGVSRTLFGMVALPNGLAMILGGTTSSSVGCLSCIADTYLLDVTAKQWTPGPPMLEARAKPTVTPLPDGSILVAGGWTPGHGDGGWGVTSATTERWHPGSDRFTPGKPMPTGMAMHRAVWMSGQEGKTLVLAGGNSAAVLAYDVGSDAWQVAAALCKPHQTENVFPVSFDGNSYLWLVDGKAGECKEGRYDSGRFPRTLVPLHLGPWQFDPQEGIALNRIEFTFIPGTGVGPSYVIGGSVNGNNQRSIRDAYAIWPGGRIEHVALDDVPDNPYQVDPATLPPDAKFRRPSYGGKNNHVVMRKLADGRVVIAGGQVQEHKIALITDKTLTPGTRDTYVGIGDFGPSYSHEILDPGTSTWHESAPATSAGGPVAVFDDGRVVKVQRQEKRSPWGTDIREKEKYLLEISSADGSQWTQLDNPPAIELSYDTQPFVIQNELFLPGRLPDSGAGSGAYAVQWLDTEHQRWETVWQAPTNDKWRLHLGRIIVRTLPNGKRIVIPVGVF